ncbi:MAG TPA: A/G-specific adenine glycosylase [Acidisoma sp.]|uniref:A/G-specific adenine glycosylase n=1 Tax=Acidisoma sp. TaxID=1872115 RepID=UPI002B7BFB4B|nr:A/G-specific adenine glycosylase [Acidisoma sp.]HTI00429.1 A/G-specific adenine glycosylase [Acidisoma sp.]
MRSSPSVARLLDWYARHRRSLPWRAEPGETADPYRVWLSEIMLQQTTVGAVIPYYERFLSLFPSVTNLAAAADDRVMAAWAGLGYYARARNLVACARAVAERGGAFPADIDGLRALPGIGAYTAAAVGAIAFGLPVVPVDGNVERVMSRVWAIDTPLPQARPLIRARAAALMEQEAARCAPSDTAQALFDLGATLCTPTTPACALCPWAETCEGRRQGIAAALPRKAPKAVRPRRHGAHFYLADEEGRVLLRRRPAKGLLGGMVEIPGTAWRADPWTLDEALAQAPVLQAGWVKRGTVRHVFTHFELLIDVYAAHVASVPTGAIDTGYLCAAGDLATQALPSLMAKCLTLGQNTRAEAAPAADYSADLLV